MKKLAFIITVFILFSGCFTQKKTQVSQNAKPKSVPKINYFTVKPSLLKEGDSIVTVSWQTNSDSVYLNGTFYNDSSKTITLTIDTAQIFELIVVKNGKSLKYNRNVQFLKKEKPKKPEVKKVTKKNNHIYSQGDYDGRFTLGTVDGYRLMYGFPIPTSTSHFVLTVDEAAATNSPHLKDPDKDITYFSGDLSGKEKKYRGDVKTEVIFMFDSVFITQIIQPVDKNFKPLPDGHLGNFYHISYKIQNLSNENKKIGLIVLMDMMIDNNDSAYTYFSKNKFISNEVSLPKEKMPVKFYILRTKDDFSDLYATTLFTNKDRPLPDTLSIGNWPHFFDVIWNINPDNSEIGDNAFILKWNKTNFKPNQTMTYSFYIGVEKTKVTMLFNNKSIDSSSITLFYERLGQKRLSAKNTAKVKEFINQYKDKDIYGIIIEAYTDAYGKEEVNNKLSDKRALYVKKVVVNAGIKPLQIITKGFGEIYASQDPKYVRNGNVKDRKVKISIFYSD